MCRRSQEKIRIYRVFLGLLVALVVAGFWVTWTNVGVYKKQKYLMRYDAGDDFREHTAVITKPVGKKIKINEDKPGTQENQQSASPDETVLNDDAISPNKVHSQTNLNKAYGHIQTILFFIGYPRSRHTLLGSLLDAHPHMVIADETRALTKWSSNPHKWMINSVHPYYDLMFNASQRVAKKGRRSRVFKDSVANATRNFRYSVPNQWQGRFDQYIEIIGDKTGGTAALTMNRNINVPDAVHLLEKTTGAKVRFIHVVRNPFDNIATMVLRNNKVKARYGGHELKVNAPDVLEVETQNYFGMAEGCNKAKGALPGSVLDVPSMEIVKNPLETLRKVCQFLEITCTEKYLLDCAATVDPVPSITRDFIEWTAEQKNTVYDMMKKYSFFEGYSLDKY